MVDLASLLSDEDLRRRYGTPTLDRAWDYVRHGHVLSCVHEVDSDGDLDIRGTVRGSTSAPYVVNVSVGVDGEGPWVFGRCSCPVHEGCKHVLALVITVRDEHARAPAGRRPALGAAAVLAARRARRPGRALQPRRRQAARAPGRPEAARRGRPATAAGRPRCPPRRRRGGRCGSARCSAAPATTGSAPASRGPTRRTSTGAATRPTRSRCSTTCCPRTGPPAGRCTSGPTRYLTLGGFGPDEVALLRRAVDVGMPLVPGQGLSDRRGGADR